MSHDGVRLERTGWRCQAISARHRQWGYNCPAVDLDFMVAEYNHGKPVALIEYKEKHAQMPSFDHPTYKALAALADGYVDGPIPLILAFYCPEDWWFVSYPINEAGNELFGNVAGHKLCEQRFVWRLYKLRKNKLSIMDEQCIEKLNDIEPTHEAA